MIFQINQNTPLAAPQFDDMTAALDQYRIFRDEVLLQMSDFLLFITRPSSDRDDFLNLFTATASIMNNKYVKQIYA